MDKPPTRTELPLEYAAELALELHLMRGECCDVARTLLRLRPRDVLAVDQCARLDEALDRAHRIMQRAVNEIRREKARLEEVD